MKESDHPGSHIYIGKLSENLRNKFRKFDLPSANASIKETPMLAQGDQFFISQNQHSAVS